MLTALHKKQQARIIADIKNFCADEWRYLDDIAAAVGASLNTTRKHSDRLLAEGVLEVRKMKIDERWRNQYRAMPPGYVAPLYHTHLDAWPLAECFGGMTFATGEQCRA